MTLKHDKAPVQIQHPGTWRQNDRLAVMVEFKISFLVLATVPPVADHRLTYGHLAPQGIERLRGVDGAVHPIHGCQQEQDGRQSGPQTASSFRRLRAKATLSGRRRTCPSAHVAPPIRLSWYSLCDRMEQKNCRLAPLFLAAHHGDQVLHRFRLVRAVSPNRDLLAVSYR